MKRGFLRTFSGVLAVVLLSVTIAIPAQAQIQSSELNRFWGNNRYQTAKAIAEQLKGGTVENVVLASGNNFPDALASSVLAKDLDAPILLLDSTASSTLEAFDYIKAHLSPMGKVYISGGTGIIGADFRLKLAEMGYPEAQVVQLGGADRYETAVKIAENLNVAKGCPVVLVTGDDFTDALTVSSFAAYNGWPMLLVGSEPIEAVTNYLKTLQPAQVYIAGSYASVNAEVEKSIKNMLTGTEIKRLSGEDRYTTEVEIIKALAKNPQEIYLASGTVFADALSGSILAAQTGSPIVLLDPNRSEAPLPVQNYLLELQKPKIQIFGGPGAISETLARSVEGIIDPAKANLQAPSLVLKEIEGVGTFHSYTFENVSIETNINMDLLNAMAATGSGFTHKGYLSGPNVDISKLNQNFVSYFSPYIGNADAKDFYLLEAAESGSGSDKKNPGRVTLGMLASKEFLGDQILYTHNPLFTDSLFKTRNLPLTGLSEVVRRFARDTNALTFFKDNREAYNQEIDDFVNNTLNFNHVQRIQDFYGTDMSKNQFKVVLTTTENGGSSTDVDDRDGIRTYYNIMSPVGDLPYQLNNIYHETAHNFYRPISVQNQDLINQYASYKDVLGYYEPSDDFQRRLNESLARVVTIVMLEQYHGKDMADNNMKSEIRRGWKNIDNIYYLVKDKYLTNREQYKTFGDFLPVILEYIKTTAEAAG